MAAVERSTDSTTGSLGLWKYYAVAEDAHPWRDAAAPRYREQALYDLSSDPKDGVSAQVRRQRASPKQ